MVGNVKFVRGGATILHRYQGDGGVLFKCECGSAAVPGHTIELRAVEDTRPPWPPFPDRLAFLGVVRLKAILDFTDVYR